MKNPGVKRFGEMELNHLFNEHFELELELLARGRGLFQNALNDPESLAPELLKTSLEQAFFAAKVIAHQAHIHACCLGELFHARPLVAAFGEELSGGF